MEKMDSRVAVPILLIADNDECRRGELRRLFSSNGFLVAAAADGLQRADNIGKVSFGKTNVTTPGKIRSPVR